MKSTIYLVNTARDPSECGIYDEGLDINKHNTFLQEMREQIPTFEMPYMALFDNGTIFIPSEWKKGYRSYVSGRVIEGIAKSGRFPDDCTLAEFIGDYVEGHELSKGRKSKGITGIIEFSPTELYPQIIEELSKNYNINRITL